MENENKGEIIIYQSDDGSIRLDVKLEDETLFRRICNPQIKAKSITNHHFQQSFHQIPYTSFSAWRTSLSEMFSRSALS